MRFPYFIVVLTFILSLGCKQEHSSHSYELEGSRWQVFAYNDENVSTVEYVEFTNQGLLSLTQKESCYESDVLQIENDNGELYSFIDDIDSTVHLSYTVINDTLNMDFVAYKVKYVRTDVDLNKLNICN